MAGAVGGTEPPRWRSRSSVSRSRLGHDGRCCGVSPARRSPERNTVRTQGRESAPSALERVRQAAKKDRKQRFTALLHHISDFERLRAAYPSTKKDAAAEVDGETWERYGEKLEEDLQELSSRLKRGAYRAKPVRKLCLAKVGKPGELRPLGVPALEDKIVQHATAEVLSAIYEQDFLISRMGSDRGAARIKRWMRWWLAWERRK